MRVKICGITCPEDAEFVEAAGADAVGFIFAKRSKRYLTLERAREISAVLGPFVARVGVFVDAPLEEVRRVVTTLRLAAVQLHGQEEPAYAAALRSSVRVIRAVSFTPGLSLERLNRFPADAFLLDGLEPGRGRAFEWSQATAFKALPKLVLAGGLTPENVGAAVATLEPYAVDVASGVESAPGIKDHQKIEAFIRAARGAVAREGVG
ncbi:MAG: phosphoribosylanthranilate isomerase [Trueperaceae bacterium]|nr:MAG: phosphoribosylanthranilate isomerase [Trueperaceae bacterium]